MPGLKLAVACCLLAGCTKEPLAEPVSVDGTYVPPAPVQLDPPPSITLDPDEPSIAANMDHDDVQFTTFGNAYRPIYAKLVDESGNRTLEIVVDNDGRTALLADAAFYLGAVGTAHEDGSIMACWNTLTGEPSEYSGTAPDPARGMALHCRMLRPDGTLTDVERIRAQTVGCWIERLVAMPDGRFRLIYKGDDGWFESEVKPGHGKYDVYFENGHWTTPSLILPIRPLEEP